MLDQGESAIGILLVAIIPTVRNLLLAKDLMERHRLPRPGGAASIYLGSEPAPGRSDAHLPRKKDGSISGYPLGIAAMKAHHFETDRLIAGLRSLPPGQPQIVTSQLDHELILTEIVVKLLGV